VLAPSLPGKKKRRKKTKEKKWKKKMCAARNDVVTLNPQAMQDMGDDALRALFNEVHVLVGAHYREQRARREQMRSMRTSSILCGFASFGLSSIYWMPRLKRAALDVGDAERQFAKQLRAFVEQRSARVRLEENMPSDVDNDGTWSTMYRNYYCREQDSSFEQYQFVINTY
jgi:hypothetical protein